MVFEMRKTKSLTIRFFGFSPTDLAVNQSGVVNMNLLTDQIIHADSLFAQYQFILNRICKGDAHFFEIAESAHV